MVELNIDIPKGFLDEETRSDFRVSQKIKEVWAVELDLMAEFDRVCKKHDIKYVVSGGTMLGAVRHHGFIPWDDDVDLMMIRDEYEKLCAIGPSEFKHPYFFQTEDTDKGYMKFFARLRNSDTTGIQKKEASSRYGFNQGIFIDIFPMDVVTDDKEKFKKQSAEARQMMQKVYEACNWGRHMPNSHDLKYKIKKNIIFPIFGSLIENFINPNKVFHQYMDICKMYNGEKSEYYSLLSFEFDHDVHYIKQKDMENIIDIDFEFLKVPIIANYDEALRWKYGNYMEFVKAPNYHGDMIFDTNMPYKKYFETHQFEDE
ncbi:MAG: LicD family protein [Prevotella sp.]|nr:LicD family protein [Prevotella sp.]